MATMDQRQELIEAARATARRLGKTAITQDEFTRETGIGRHAAYVHFDSWGDLCGEAGLESGRPNYRIPDEALYRAMRDAFVEAGGIVTRDRFGRRFRYSLSAFYRRGMNWPDALRAFRQWAGENAPDFPYLGELPDGPAPRPRPPWCRKPPAGRVWPAGGGRAFGDSLDFRVLRHAPVNELGVALLFGMVAAELGFMVEGVAPGFPDCEGKRQVAPGRWERVRIEFEYRSRAFRDHGHDPAGCDLIVCWEHDWPDCPVEVLALKTEIENLPGATAAA